MYTTAIALKKMLNSRLNPGKQKTGILVLLGLFIALSACFADSGSDATGAYRKNSRELDNYMKIATKWDPEDLREGNKLIIDLEKVDDKNSRETVNAFGSRILKKYSNDINSLLKSWEKLLSIPLPEPRKFDSLADSEGSMFLDLNFCQKLACTMAAVTMCLDAEGRADDAIKIFMLNLRFIQYFVASDGFYTGFLAAKKVSRIVVGPGIWNIINSGKVSKPVLKTAIQNLSKMRKEELDFSIFMENFFKVRLWCMELFRQDCLVDEKTELPEILKPNELYFKVVGYAMTNGNKGQPSHDQINTMIDEIILEMKKMISKYKEIFQKYKLKLCELVKQDDAFYEKDLLGAIKTDGNGLPIDAGEVSNFQYLGKRFLGIFPSPDFIGFYQSRIELNYRIIGTGLLAVAIYGEGSSRRDLKSILTSVEKLLPLDLYCDPHKPCCIGIKGNVLSAWAIGTNGDQGGDPENDVILFSISR